LIYVKVHISNLGMDIVICDLCIEQNLYTVGLSLGPYGGPRRGAVAMSEVPLHRIESV